MITPIVKDTKVVFGPCRLSYVHVFEKFNPDNVPGGGKYMTVVLIPKEEKETMDAVRKAIETARANGISSKWGGKVPKTLEMPLRDGDDKDDEAFEDQFYINAKSSTRPGVVDRNNVPITDEEEVYSGMWAYVSVTFYPYDSNGKKGVACGLNNIKKFKDGERFGGRASAETDFAGIGEEDEDL